MFKIKCPFLLATTVAMMICFTTSAQVNLPYTLSFSSNSTAAWADGIAQDGDGGTQGINGLDIQIFAANPTTFAPLAGSTMRWLTNTYYFSGHSDYTALTPGPDPGITTTGFQAMVIKSTNPAVNFSLSNIRLYDWGGTTTTRIATYNDGVLIGSTNVTFSQVTYNTVTLTTASGLPAATFQNIDEIRFTPVSDTKFWLSLNNIGLSNVGVLPVALSNFDATPQANGTAILKWTTQQEINTVSFTIEHSNDGISFAPAGQVAAAGNRSTPTSYSFTTGIQRAGNHYYRLKTADINGSSSYSAVKTVSIAALSAVSIYPNPVKDRVNISAGGSLIRQVNIYNTSGRRLLTQKINAANASINLSGMIRASYYVDIITDKGTYREVIVKE